MYDTQTEKRKRLVSVSSLSLSFSHSLVFLLLCSGVLALVNTQEYVANDLVRASLRYGQCGVVTLTVDILAPKCRGLESMA